MTKIVETPRLLMREFLTTDVQDLFEMDRLPEVHRFIDNRPVTNITQVEEGIRYLQQQYNQYGIGRWAVIEKATNTFIGWSGLKFYTTPINKHCDFYELGYRFHPKAWGKGFATEAAKAWLDYGFDTLAAQEVFAMTHPDHRASKNVLTKVGFHYIETFIDPEYGATTWYKINRTQRV